MLININEIVKVNWMIIYVIVNFMYNGVVIVFKGIELIYDEEVFVNFVKIFICE